MIRMHDLQKPLLITARDIAFSAESMIREILSQGY
jgi:hypothetical protein